MSRIYQILITAALLYIYIYTLQCLYIRKPLYGMQCKRKTLTMHLDRVYILIGATNFFHESNAYTRAYTHKMIWYQKICYIHFWLPHIMHTTMSNQEQKIYYFDSKRQTQPMWVCMCEPIVKQAECRKWISFFAEMKMNCMDMAIVHFEECSRRVDNNIRTRWAVPVFSIYIYTYIYIQKQRLFAQNLYCQQKWKHKRD